MQLLGLHHVTAIASDARRNVAFYTNVLGLRLIKKTVNFDDPSTYHLYYGDRVGTPGSVLTFFPWDGIRRGRPGTGQVYATAFSVGAGALPFWEQRLRDNGVAFSPATRRFGDAVLAFADPDGLILELVATAAPDPRSPWANPEIPQTHGIRGFHNVTLALAEPTRTHALLTTAMGYRVAATEGQRTRLTIGDGAPGTFVDVLTDSSLPRGVQSGGTVHHVAFRAPDDAAQAVALDEVRALGLYASPVMDRKYFHSIYYREPEGILFEIATDTPGFAIDEPVESLGTRLMLQPHYEAQRAEIEAHLQKLD